MASKDMFSVVFQSVLEKNQNAT